jgi:hypothetical protein
MGGNPFTASFSTTQYCTLIANDWIVLVDFIFNSLAYSSLIYSFFNRWINTNSKSNKQEAEGSSISGFNATLSFCLITSLIRYPIPILELSFLLRFLTFETFTRVASLFKTINPILTTLIFLGFHKRVRRANIENVRKVLKIFKILFRSGVDQNKNIELEDGRYEQPRRKLSLKKSNSLGFNSPSSHCSLLIDNGINSRTLNAKIINPLSGDDAKKSHFFKQFVPHSLITPLSNNSQLESNQYLSHNGTQYQSTNGNYGNLDNITKGLLLPGRMVKSISIGDNIYEEARKSTNVRLTM